jgi:hypothetical protein
LVFLLNLSEILMYLKSEKLEREQWKKWDRLFNAILKLCSFMH